MEKLKKICIKFLEVSDKIAYCILAVFIVGTIFNLNFFAFDLKKCGDDLQTADEIRKSLSFSLAIITLLFFVKTKYPKAAPIEMLLWIGLFLAVPYLLHRIPSVVLMYGNF